MSPIGAPAAAAVMHEVHYIGGASKFIIYGSSGILDSESCKGNLIVPTASYRDEGLSYHYMEASDYVDIKNADKLAQIFDKLKYPYVMGKTGQPMQYIWRRLIRLRPDVRMVVLQLRWRCPVYKLCVTITAMSYIHFSLAQIFLKETHGIWHLWEMKKNIIYKKRHLKWQ